MVTAKPTGCAGCAPPAWPVGHQRLATPARRAARCGLAGLRPVRISRPGSCSALSTRGA